MMTHVIFQKFASQGGICFCCVIKFKPSKCNMDTAWIPPNMFFKKVFPYLLSNMDIFLGVAMLNFHDSGFRGPWLVHWSNLGDR